VTLIDPEHETEVPIAAKEEIAEAILARVEQLRAQAARPAG
jgi:hypothetical protein